MRTNSDRFDDRVALVQRVTHQDDSVAEAAKRLCPNCRIGAPILPGQHVSPAQWCCSLCGYRLKERDDVPLLAPELADTETGFDPANFSYRANVEANYFWFVACNEFIAGLPIVSCDARSLLEIGCGNCAVLRILTAGRNWERMVGSDLHPTGLATAQTRVQRNAEFVQMDATRGTSAEQPFLNEVCVGCVYGLLCLFELR